MRIEVARKVSVVTPKDLMRKDISDTSIADSNLKMTDLLWVIPGEWLFRKEVFIKEVEDTGMIRLLDHL